MVKKINESGIPLSQELLDSEIYTIPFDNKTSVVYAPITRRFVIYDGFPTNNDIDKEWIEEATNLSNIPDYVKNGFNFVRYGRVALRLNVTSQCNLCCEYCSVNSTKSKQASIMEDDFAIVITRHFLEYTKTSGMNILEITFSGGEPTLCLSLIEKVIHEVTYMSGKIGIKIKVKLITNGILNRKKLFPLIKYFSNIQVSWDGFLKNNPRYGKDSTLARTVWDNLDFLCNQGAKVSILTVVSKYNYMNLGEILNDLESKYGKSLKIFLAIKEDLGRAKGKRDEINYLILEKLYFDLWKYYREKDVDINLTGTSIHTVSPYPCGITSPNYSISPDGTISACTLTFNDNSKLSNKFNFGVVNNKGILINKIKIDDIRKMHVLNFQNCSNCFAKWHCRNGCPYYTQGKWLGQINPARCEMIQNIIKKKIKYLCCENK